MTKPHSGTRYTAADMLGQPVNFGGEIMALGTALNILTAEGHSPRLIDRWMFGTLQAKELRRETTETFS